MNLDQQTEESIRDETNIELIEIDDQHSLAVGLNSDTINDGTNTQFFDIGEQQPDARCCTQRMYSGAVL